MDLSEREHERYTVRLGDVLFNRTNSAELVGKTAIFRETRSMAFAGYLIRLRVTGNNHPEYLAGFMNTPYAKRVLRGMCKSIVGMANINAPTVNDGDLVFVQNASMTDASSLGSMTAAPKRLDKADSGGWALWEKLAQGRPQFGKELSNAKSKTPTFKVKKR